MTVRYHHEQTGWVMLFAFGPSIVALLALSGFLATQFPAPTVLVPLLIAVLMAVFIALFYSMTIEVTDAELNWYFGPRFWKHRLSLLEIDKATPIRAKWYWGYGIKYFGPKRWLYSVSGLDAVELTLKNGGWFRIGTDDVAGLMQALRDRGL
jgi:hypothetical protein